jgi:CRP-like cAMP-binding protein
MHSLSGIRIFSELAPRDLALLAAECDWRTVAKDEIVASTAQGGDMEGVTFVVAGTVRMARASGPVGRISYRDVGTGGQFGEMSVFGVAETDLTVIARDDGLIATMNAGRFAELLAREESVSRALLCQYALLLRGQEAMSASPVSEEGEAAIEGTGAQRLYIELLALAEPHVGKDGADALLIARLPRHRVLADRISTTEEAVARAIAELVRSGVAERDYPGLVIKNEAALRGLAGAC